MGLLVPILLVLAAAMFANNIGGDSVTGLTISGDGETCEECKDNCKGAYDSAVKTCGDIFTGCNEGAFNSYDTCIAENIPFTKCRSILKSATGICEASKVTCITDADAAKKACDDTCDENASSGKECEEEPPPEEGEEEEEEKEEEKDPECDHIGHGNEKLKKKCIEDQKKKAQQ